MNVRYYYWTVPLLVLLVAVGGHRGSTLADAVARNFLRSRLVTDWMQLRQFETVADVGLTDGIPDGWAILAWGGAKASFYLDEQEPVAGSRVAVIERTNALGGAALVQNVSIRSGGEIHISVFAKGKGGALQVQYRRYSKDNWHNGGWMEIFPTAEWEEYRLSVVVPPENPEVRLLLRPSQGITIFDRAYLGFEEDGNSRSNLLANSDFEQDGVVEDPLAWWQNQAERVHPVSVREPFLDERDLSINNIADMSSGNFEAIKRRAQELGGSCATRPEMTGWLLALGATGTEMYQERYYLLAAELAPNCPQPYAARAKLHASRLAFKSAADLYHKASELSEGTVIAGRYAFEEGFIHVRYTGKTTEAISALKKAIIIGGWEQGVWYRGAASLYLGYALEAKGLYDEASLAFQQVLDCAVCDYHNAEALKRLESLKLHAVKSPQEP